MRNPIRVPPDAPRNTQSAFDDVNAALIDIQRQIDQLSSVAPDATIADLKRTVAKLGRKPNSLDFNDVVRASGPAHALGYAPDPGLQADYEATLNEDGRFRPLFRGVIRLATRLGILSTDRDPVAGNTPFAGEIVNLLGSLAITGNIGASKAYLKDLEVLHRTNLPQVIATVVSTEGNVGSAETTLAGYTFVIPANTLKFNGESIDVFQSWSFAANTNLKTVKLYLDALSGTLFTTSANVASNVGILYFRILRAALSGAGSAVVLGFILKDVANQNTVSPFVISFALAAGGWDTDQVFSITAQGTNTDDARMFRMSAHKFTR